MILERLILQNFRCFGPEPETIRLGNTLTAFIGTNGAGKTAVMLALLRLFGISGDHRRLRRQDFHAAATEKDTPAQRTLVLEAILAFPELAKADADHAAVPEFFQQMAADEAGILKCRLRLEATWTNDGSVEGAIDFKYRAVRTLAAAFTDEDCSDLSAIDRARVQMIYIPATRDGTSQVTSFLRGRLWRAVNWSAEIREELGTAGSSLNDAFEAEAAVELITEAVARRWKEVHTGGTDAEPKFRPIDLRFEEFVRKIEVLFEPDEEGRARGLEDLSDGQRSLFHIAMTAATLDVERRIAEGEDGFQEQGIPLPALTLVALEEPENNLAPFYLSRIIRQLVDLAGDGRAQAVVSSHSASILARVDPGDVRHLRVVPKTRTARVREIPLPDKADEAGKFVREAVMTYPELYFARFVILGEGASEEIVLPRLADAMELPIDRSFVAIVPLGGRHVNHLWKLLAAIEVPYATLLDLDWGRNGGGWPRIKVAIDQLMNNGVKANALFTAAELKAGVEEAIKALLSRDLQDEDGFKDWIERLRKFNVFFCDPLDLDMTMLEAFGDEYRVLEPGMEGPDAEDDTAPRVVLGKKGDPDAYSDGWDGDFRWYRYLFLGRGKPVTHMRVLSRVSDPVLVKKCPEVLSALLGEVVSAIEDGDDR
jgi:predicted ATP-dependent endonuclease of OLD family